MTEQQKNQNQDEKQNRNATTGTNANHNAAAKQQPGNLDESTRLWKDDVSSGVSEDSAYDASGAATGGGVDTPTAVEESTEDAVRKNKPIDQGSSAYAGGGADNGTDL
jgi:hypothetical protein